MRKNYADIKRKANEEYKRKLESKSRESLDKYMEKYDSYEFKKNLNQKPSKIVEKLRQLEVTASLTLEDGVNVIDDIDENEIINFNDAGKVKVVDQARESQDYQSGSKKR